MTTILPLDGIVHEGAAKPPYACGGMPSMPLGSALRKCFAPEEASPDTGTKTLVAKSDVLLCAFPLTCLPALGVFTQIGAERHLKET